MSAALGAKAGSVEMHQLLRRRNEIPWQRHTRHTWSSLTSPSAWASRWPVQVLWPAGALDPVASAGASRCSHHSAEACPSASYRSIPPGGVGQNVAAISTRVRAASATRPRSGQCSAPGLPTKRFELVRSCVVRSFRPQPLAKSALFFRTQVYDCRLFTHGGSLTYNANYCN